MATQTSILAWRISTLAPHERLPEILVVPREKTPMPWRRTWQPTPVLLPGESHGQRSLAGYSPEGCKESDMALVRALSSPAGGSVPLTSSHQPSPTVFPPPYPSFHCHTYRDSSVQQLKQLMTSHSVGSKRYPSILRRRAVSFASPRDEA